VWNSSRNLTSYKIGSKCQYDSVEPKQAVSAIKLKDFEQIKDEDWEDLETSSNK